MKKVLFVINALDGGGAEKSLVSLLNELEQYKDEYSFDLLIPNKKGLFYNQIPDFINEITVSKSMKYMANGFKELISLRELNPYLIFIKLRWVLKQKRLSTVVGGIWVQSILSRKCLSESERKLANRKIAEKYDVVQVAKCFEKIYLC